MKIEVNGIELFYEKEGSGPPLVLLHGNGEDHFIFDESTELLKRNFTVYRPDSRGHGGSSRTAELHYQDMADDVACFIETLGLDRPVLFGFSDGGIIGLLAASQHPQLLSALIVSGANTEPKGLKPFIYGIFRLLFVFKKDPAIRLMLTEPNITKDELGRIHIPVLVTAGQRDMIRAEHTRLIAEHIPGSRLVILPGESHGSYIVHSRKIAKIIEEAVNEN
ncbi:alpha/beta hydrolase [Anaerovorax odorimutans]|uniref:Alpha/beta hydrolase n=1 Tax=Anaerovorax odorimutans TaxID=109327 RepID=A0ABT1RRY9_9FIRM|nr:alpha/beta hydrolase [Anaerovorax odorimutans]MCQ4637914.1 alpha/beta hydrolase [Anaerovorax odorimutans]